MTILRRIADLFKIKASKALDRAEDPREVLDYSYSQQMEMLQKVRRGLADVATSRKRVELQLNQLQQSAGKLQAQAQQALGTGREDLAREALTRRSGVLSQVTDLQAQEASLQAEEEKLAAVTQRLEAKVEAFRTRKETIKATYTAAEAETHINEAVTGISEEMGDVGMAMQRAQDKTEQMQARASALDELIASGALEDATLPAGRDDIQAQLDAVTAGSDVEEELARMKAQLRSRPSRRTRHDRAHSRRGPVRCCREHLDELNFLTASCSPPPPTPTTVMPSHLHCGPGGANAAMVPECRSTRWSPPSQCCPQATPVWSKRVRCPPARAWSRMSGERTRFQPDQPMRPNDLATSASRVPAGSPALRRESGEARRTWPQGTGFGGLTAGAQRPAGVARHISRISPTST
jgi:phage shock protein A